MYYIGQPPDAKNIIKSMCDSINVVQSNNHLYVQKVIQHEFGFISHTALTEIDMLQMLQSVNTVVDSPGTIIFNKPSFWKRLFGTYKLHTEIYMTHYPQDLMEYSLKTLSIDIYDRGRLAPQILKDICISMYIVQKLGVSHHDIKPDNILVSPDKPYTLCDFGLSKICVGDCSPSGTLNYAAPELIFDHLPRLSYAHDYYSLGICICNYILCKYIVDQKTLDRMRNYLRKEYPHIDTSLNGGLNISEVQPYVDELTYTILTNLCLFNPQLRYTPECILQLYNCELPSIDMIYENYPIINIPIGKRVWKSQIIADEIYSRYIKINPQPSNNIKQACIELAQLRLHRYCIPEIYRSTVMHILKTLNYRVYNPRLASMLV